MRNIISSIESEYHRYKALGEGAIAQLADAELSTPGPNAGNSVAVIEPLTPRRLPDSSSTRVMMGTSSPMGYRAGVTILSWASTNSAAAESMVGYGVQGGKPHSELPRVVSRTMN